MTDSFRAKIDPPGSFIKEELDARDWSQTDLAYILDMSPQQLNRTLSGKNSLSADMAVLLGDAFGMPAEFFSNLENQYRLSKAKAAPPDVKTRAKWQAVYPIREMLKRKWIEETDSSLLDTQMLRFFEKNNIDDIPYIGMQAQSVGYAAKKTPREIPTAEELAWLYRVRQIAKNIEAPKFNKKKLSGKVDVLKTLLNAREEVVSVPRILNECGVRFLVVETLPKAKIDGVCTWIKDQPVIAITNRYDRLDNFWFVVRHEIEHVLHGHGKKVGYSAIDDLDGDNGSASADIAEEERLANAAAANFCIPAGQLESFIARKSPYISERDVVGFARRLEIHPALAIGQIQHATGQWSFLRKYLASAVCGVRDTLLAELKNQNIIDGWGCPAQTHL